MSLPITVKTIVGLVACVLVVVAIVAESQLSNGDGCRMECPKMNQKSQGKQACRWILRTDGKPARLCEQPKCKRVCPKENQEVAASNTDEQTQTRVEQQIEGTSSSNQEADSASSSSTAPAPAPAPAPAMGIMQQRYGNKLKQAPVPGVAGGRLAPDSQPAAAPAATQQNGARRFAPTLPPEINYDDTDTPPPISRFLDISPEE